MPKTWTFRVNGKILKDKLLKMTQRDIENLEILKVNKFNQFFKTSPHRTSKF